MLGRTATDCQSAYTTSATSFRYLVVDDQPTAPAAASARWWGVTPAYSWAVSSRLMTGNLCVPGWRDHETDLGGALAIRPTDLGSDPRA